MSRRLDDLREPFKSIAFELLARLVEANIHVLIVGTGRTAAEQAAYVKAGTSWVQRSKHQDGLAIDVCPYEVWSLRGPDKLEWDCNDPVWLKIALIGEKLGLVSGYRWKVKDCGHLEYAGPSPKIKSTIA